MTVIIYDAIFWGDPTPSHPTLHQPPPTISSTNPIHHVLSHPNFYFSHRIRLDPVPARRSLAPREAQVDPQVLEYHRFFRGRERRG